MDLNSAVISFDNTANKFLSPLRNEYVSSALLIFLIVYASYAAPRLPGYILVLFDHPLIKLLLFFLIAYSAKQNPTVSIIAAIALLVTIHALNKAKLDQVVRGMLITQENMRNVSAQMEEQHVAMPERIMEERIQEEDIATNVISELSSESKSEPGCEKKMNFRNDFYPQYVNMKPDAYEARYKGFAVDCHDENPAYASV